MSVPLIKYWTGRYRVLLIIKLDDHAFKMLHFSVSHFYSPCREFAKTYISKTGFIGFYSKTPLEDIKGENNQVYAVLDPASHHMAFAVLLKGFIFPKELMQEHFNENYVESDKFPKATFSGTCSGEMDLQRMAYTRSL